jgi:carboxyl-terminal processing protease
MKTISKSEKQAIIAKIKKLVLKYHINVANVDYDTWARGLDAKSPDLGDTDEQQFEAGVRTVLAELKTSHTAFFHNAPDRMLPQHTLNATVRKVSVDGSDYWMFLDVFEGGAADRGGVRPGSLLFAIDESPVLTDDVPKFALGRRYKLTIGGPDPNRREDITVEVPFVKGSKASPPLVPPKTIAHKMLEPGLGYVKIGWFTASMGLGFSKELDAAIADLKARGCERLIIDLRGNIGGGLGFARLASYLCPGKIPIGQSLTPKRLRSGYIREELPRVPMPSTALGLVSALTRFLIRDKSLVLLTQGLGPQPFHGNVAILVNEWTNSAAEMVANFAQENKAATIVGTRTCGTVLGASNFAVGAGYWLRLPVFGWFTSNGTTIEGSGVVPDFQVDIVPDLLNEGEDKQLAAARKAVGATPTAMDIVVERSFRSQRA